MKLDVELLKTSKKRPIKIIASEFDYCPIHMHSQTEILIVLKGDATLKINQESYNLNEKDIVIINPKEIHELTSNNKCIILSTFFDISLYLDDEKADNIIFDLNSVIYPNNSKYETIRYFIYSIIRLNSQNNVNAYLNTKSICYSLIAQLMNNFKTDISSTIISDKSFDTITKITNYINEYYQENISLGNIAEKFNYTESHVSKLFKNSLNKTFIEYYDALRVNYSIDDLTLTNTSIEEIAYQHGFETSRSYVRAFKNIYNCYPSEYRKKNKELEFSSNEDKSKLIKEVLDIIMAKYLRYIKRNNIVETVRATKEIISIENLNNYEKIENPTSLIIKLGNINFLYNSNVINELKEIQNQMKYRYIELTSIFAQTARMYKKINNEYMLNKPMIDNIAKIIYDLKLSPYFKFDFTIFVSSSELITLFLKYFMKNTPYEFNDIMISINFEQQIEYTLEEKYTYIYKIIEYFAVLKKKTNKIKFISPSIDSIDDYKIVTSSNKNRNIFDYISINYITSTNTTIAKNPNEVKDFFEKIDKIYSTKLNNIIIEDVNFTGSCNLLNDTLFSSSYQTKNIIDIYPYISASVMNNMFDVTIENFFDNNPYLGYNGYYTFNYIKKASFNSIYFLSKLKNNILKKGKNFIVSFEDNKIVIILNNYVHYSELFAENEYFELTDQDRYKCFSKYTDINFIFEIKNVPFNKARIKTTYLNKKSGSSYDIYKEISKDETLTNDELNIMKELCAPRFKIEMQRITKGLLKISTTVNPLETKIIEITLN